MILRSTEWDGLPPATGDVVQGLGPDGLGVGVVMAVAQGPGVGQWRMDVTPARAITWWPSARVQGPTRPPT